MCFYRTHFDVGGLHIWLFLNIGDPCCVCPHTKTVLFGAYTKASSGLLIFGNSQPQSEDDNPFLAVSDCCLGLELVGFLCVLLY